MIANESTTSSLEGPIQCPHARGEVDDLVVQEIYDELVVYDLRRHKVHSLNATASLIWRWCDGQTLPEQVAQRLTGQLGIPQDQAESLVWLGLDRLEQANLLRGKAAWSAGQGVVTRRQALRLIGATALLPVVYSIVAPAVADAQSQCLPNDSPCSRSSQCCSNCCKAQGGGAALCKPGGGNCLP